MRLDETPTAPFYSLVFQAALNSGVAIAQGAFDAVERTVDQPGKNATLNSFLADAKSLTLDETASERTIAVIGDSGEGMTYENFATQSLS